MKQIDKNSEKGDRGSNYELLTFLKVMHDAETNMKDDIVEPMDDMIKFF